MELEKMYRAILDCEHNTYIASSKCMQEMNEDILSMIEKRQIKLLPVQRKNAAHFKEGSIAKSWIENYTASRISFEEISEKLAKHIFDLKDAIWGL